MFVITGFGILIIFLSLIMIVSPKYWSEGIISFSKKYYFHWFEIISRLIVGSLFIILHKQAVYPNLILGMGYLLVMVSLGLVFVGANKHRQFAVWSANKFRKVFRVSGVVSLFFGTFLIIISSFSEVLIK